MSRTYISVALRRDIINTAGNCCEYCRISQEDIFFAFEIDHIIAEKHRGATQADNLCLSCPDCNAFKGSDIASVDWDDNANIIRLYHPRLHTWHEHFKLDEKTGYIQPITPIGRVTVFLLNINDSERTKDRQLLIDAQRYPCT